MQLGKQLHIAASQPKNRIRNHKKPNKTLKYLKTDRKERVLWHDCKVNDFSGFSAEETKDYGA